MVPKLSAPRGVHMAEWSQKPSVPKSSYRLTETFCTKEFMAERWSQNLFYTIEFMAEWVPKLSAPKSSWQNPEPQHPEFMAEHSPKELCGPRVHGRNGLRNFLHL
jgi:hypothetical protein